MPKRKRIVWGRAILYAVLIIGSLGMAFPMMYAVLGSFCDLEDFYRNPWFPVPTKLYLNNWTMFFSNEFNSQTPLWTWVLNTLIRIVWYITIPATVAVFAGYVFARRKFKGRDTAFMFLLSSMMMPGIVFLIPTYVMMARFPGVGGNDWTGQGDMALSTPGLRCSSLVWSTSISSLCCARPTTAFRPTLRRPRVWTGPAL
jgi:multiple sugar transport system permease protein